MLVQAVDTNVYKNKSYANSPAFTGILSGKKKSDKTKDRLPVEQQVKMDMQEALSLLGKDLQIIIHNASAPSTRGRDVGIGSLYSNSSKDILIPFMDKYSISGVQVEPEGIRPLHDSSPYVSNSMVYNPLIIDLEELTKPENGALLEKSVYGSIVKLNHVKNSSRGDFDYAKDSSNLALANSWENFKSKSENPDLIRNEKEKAAIERLKSDFEQYKAQNADMLEPYAIYNSVLTPMFDNDYYENWPDEMNNLYNPKNEALIDKIKSEHQDEIDKFMFIDMLAKQTRDKGIENFEKNGIKTLGDNPVAFSEPEYWAHKSAFLEGYKMGCPPDGDNPKGQAWGFHVLHPGKLFNKDGSLGESGQLLYDKCLKLAKDNQGGIRIDHIAGLIDPFVYKNSPTENTAGRLFSSEHNPELKQYAIPRGKADTAKKFGAILEKIVIPACEEAGVKKKDVLCEDLGAIPDHARAAFNRLGLGGMVVTQWHNGRSAKPQDTIMLGSHDTVPFVSYVENLYGPYGQDEFNHKLWTAVENSMPQDASHDEKQAEFDKYRFDYNRGKPEENKQAFLQKKFTELFTSPADRVQIFWTDLLGLKDRYNTPGTTKDNWNLRLSADFEKQFDPTLLIKGLEGALKAQDEEFVEEHKDLIVSLHQDAKELAKPGSKLNLNV